MSTVLVLPSVAAAQVAERLIPVVDLPGLRFEWTQTDKSPAVRVLSHPAMPGAPRRMLIAAVTAAPADITDEVCGRCGDPECWHFDAGGDVYSAGCMGNAGPDGGCDCCDYLPIPSAAIIGTATVTVLPLVEFVPHARPRYRCVELIDDTRGSLLTATGEMTPLTGAWSPSSVPVEITEFESFVDCPYCEAMGIRLRPDKWNTMGNCLECFHNPGDGVHEAPVPWATAPTEPIMTTLDLKELIPACPTA